MRFWDASALVPLLIAEPTSRAGRVVLESDPSVVVWWGARVECTAALARSERDGRIGSDDARGAFGDLDRLRFEWTEVDPHDAVRSVAERLVRTHALRAAGALQLAAAIAAAEGSPASLPFVTLDDRLAMAAEREGFPVVRFDRPAA
ncbi:MAG: type II toxin-antitoxin system VapC family toxin [Candidatus Limnocylindrales bacterium]